VPPPACSAVRLSARERKQDRGERAERRDVSDVDAQAAERHSIDSQSREHGRRRDGSEQDANPQRVGGEDGMRDDEAAGRAEVVGEQCTRPGAGDPAGEACDNREDENLGRGNEQDLRAPRTRPGEPAAHVAVIAAEARRRKHREAEQQDRRIAAEDQQALCGDAARCANRRHRVGRRGNREDVRPLLELRLRAVEPHAEARKIPVMDRTRCDGNDPAVRPRDQRRVGERCPLERQNAVGDQNRRPLPAAAEVRVERSAGPERRAADDVQKRQARRHGLAADLDQLAIRRGARARQAAAAKVEPAREPVDGPEVHERASPRRLAEDDQAERLLPEDRLGCIARDAIELQVGEVRLRRHAAPHRLDRAVGRLQLSERPLDGPILHGRAPHRRHSEHCCADGDPQGDDQRARPVDAQTAKRVPHRHGHALAHRVLAAARPAGGCGLHWP
jgi:hypothetical protein